MLESLNSGFHPLSRIKMTLFTAGPAQTPQIILDALASPPLHHRSEAFFSLLGQCKQGLQNLIPMPHVFVLCASGSGGMESALSSLVPRKILVLNHGKFSQRWLEIADSLQIPTHDFKIPSNQSHSPDRVVRILQEDPQIDCVCMQTCESSAGVSQNFCAIAQSIKSHNSQILVCVDGIASLGIENIDTQHIDIFIASSQKALMLPVGLAFIFLSPFAYSLLEKKSPKSHYLALQNYKNDIPFSLPSNLFVALHTSLQHIIPQENYDLIAKRFELINTFFKIHGIELFALQPSKGIIAFKDEGEAIKSKLQRLGIFISGGQGELKNHISRIGNFGILQDFDILLRTFEKIGHASLNKAH